MHRPHIRYALFPWLKINARVRMLKKIDLLCFINFIIFNEINNHYVINLILSQNTI